MGSTLQLEVWQNYGTSYRKKKEVEVLPDVDLMAASAKKKKKNEGDATQVRKISVGSNRSNQIELRVDPT